ncbi:MFS transporter [Nocardiopsis sp. RSe5-2]|uniref:MFS transporter n=1 Tax=Nocardiopsis endophytica TaxID=3018445 RepID=A0ABT4U838_9ACTN|nr:MFS transporter [Nocardiopsis endophytica]MDA2813122.1 MFS transporter [Nocardiopsis endophytica]
MTERAGADASTDSTTPTGFTPHSAPGADRRPRGPGPAFGRFWGAYTAGNLADGMMLTAFPLVAALLTSDPLLVGGLTAVRFLPWLLFGIVSGAIVDRVDRVRAMRTVALVRASAMGCLAVLLATGNATIWALYAVMFAVMVCETVYDGAARAHVPTIVARDRLDAANSRMEGGRVVTEDFGGAPVAGLLFGVAAALPVATGGLAYLLSAVVLIAVPATARRVPEDEQAEGAGEERPPRRAVLRAVAADTRDGFRYLARNRVQAGLVGLTLGLGFGFQMASSVLVLFVQHELGVPAHLFGVFVSASAVGALVGAAVASPLARRVSKRVLIVGGFVLAGLFLAAMGAMASPWAAALIWGLVGAVLLMANALGYAVLQAITPNGLFGRVEGVRKALGWGLAPVGALLGGVLGRIDLAIPIVVGGLIIAAVTVVFHRAITGSVRLAEEAD